MNLKDFVGKSLDGFVLREMTEVYKTDNDGRKSRSVGFFQNPDVAEAFAGNQQDANWHQTAKHLVFTNGEEGFLIGQAVTLLDDEEAALKAREAALAKLTPAERALLKI